MLTITNADDYSRVRFPRTFPPPSLLAVAAPASLTPCFKWSTQVSLVITNTLYLSKHPVV